MKNHKWIDGKLLQTNKKYAQLKQIQKEKIYQWMYDAYKARYQELGRYPDVQDTDIILDAVMQKMENAQIHCHYREVQKHFHSCVPRFRDRLQRENREVTYRINSIEPLNLSFSVCKMEDYSLIDIDQPFVFTGRTDCEKSLLCPTEMVPENAMDRDDGWKAFRICAEMDFSLIGVLARISKILSSHGISIFAVSTYNTDYVLVKEENFKKALTALKNSGYQIINPGSDTDR